MGRATLISIIIEVKEINGKYMNTFSVLVEVFDEVSSVDGFSSVHARSGIESKESGD